jgi:hypothetical protein
MKLTKKHDILYFPGEETTYKSIDSSMTPEKAVHVPVEFVISLDISGISHRISN